MGGGGWYYVPKVSRGYYMCATKEWTLPLFGVLLLCRVLLGLFFNDISFEDMDWFHSFLFLFIYFSLGLVPSWRLVEQPGQLETEYRHCRCRSRCFGHGSFSSIQQSWTSSCSASVAHSESILVQTCGRRWPAFSQIKNNTNIPTNNGRCAARLIKTILPVFFVSRDSWHSFYSFHYWMYSRKGIVIVICWGYHWFARYEELFYQMHVYVRLKGNTE